MSKKLMDKLEALESLVPNHGKTPKGSYWKIVTDYYLSFTPQERIEALTKLLGSLDKIKQKLQKDYLSLIEVEREAPSIYLDPSGFFWWVPLEETKGRVPDYWALNKDKDESISIEALVIDEITRKDLKKRKIKTLQDLQKHKEAILQGVIDFDRLETRVQLKQILNLV